MGIYKSLPILARALSDQLGVTVTIGGTEAYASVNGNKSVINIPFYKNADELSNAILGFTVHEAAHIRFTEFEQFTPAFNALVDTGLYNRDVLHSLWNIAEDLRIERSIVRRYPGSIKFLDAVRSLIFSDEPQPCDVPAVIFLDAMLLCGRQRYHGFQTHCDIRRSEFIDTFGQTLFDNALDLLGMSVLAENTLGCLDVAKQLYDLAIDAFQAENQAPQQNASTPEDDSSDENSSSDEISPSEESNLSPTTSPSDPTSTSDVASNGETVSSKIDPFANTDSSDISQAIKDISEKFNDAVRDKLTPFELNSVVSPFTIASAKSTFTDNTAVSRGIQFSAGLRQSLHGLLQGMQHVRRTHKDTGLKLDSRIVSTALTGNMKLFKHKSKTVDINSAFTILLDSSGSMDTAIVEAEAAVVSLLYALDNLKGVTVSAYHFPHRTSGNVGLLKSRHQTLRQAINANQFGIQAKGSTPLAESLWPALTDLATAKSDRRILIICTDGAPDNVSDVIHTIKEAKADGFYVIGIGFGSAEQDLMTKIFGNTGVAVGNISALREKLFNVTRVALSIC